MWHPNFFYYQSKQARFVIGDAVSWTEKSKGLARSLARSRRGRAGRRPAIARLVWVRIVISFRVARRRRLTLQNLVFLLCDVGALCVGLKHGLSSLKFRRKTLQMKMKSFRDRTRRASCRGSALVRPCLIHPEILKLFNISRHIKSCGTCIKH